MSKTSDEEVKAPSKHELSKWEVDDMKTWFKFFDKNGDGKLDKKELMSVFKAKGLTVSDKDIEDIFKKAGKGEFDENDYEQFLSSFRKNKEEEKTDLLQKLQKFDPDHKGYIAKRQILDYFQDEDVPNLQDVIKKVDKEKNGKINPTDFVDALLED